MTAFVWAVLFMVKKKRSMTQDIYLSLSWLLVLCLLLGSARLSAQDKYMIHFEPDKKIIYTELLGMPDHTLVTDVLHLLPELINRGDLAFEKFDLQYDGKSIGESRDVILSQIRIADVEKIEISTSAVATHANNGQSGSINIVPAKKKEGLHGMAFLEGDLFWGIMPGVNLTYKKNKAEFGAMVNLEGMKTGQDRSFVETGPYMNRISMESTENRYFQQTAKIDFHYTFSEKDEIKAWLVESSGDYKVRTISDFTKSTDMSEVFGPGMALVEKGTDTTLTRSQGLILEMNTEYQHHFTKNNKLTLNADWSTRSGEGYAMNDAPYKISTQAKMEARIFGDDARYINLKTGISTNYDHFSSPISNGHGLFVSPSAELQYRQRSLSVNAAAQFQYYDKVFHASNANANFNSTDHDFTSHLNMVWSMAQDHALKINLSRNIIRPADQMLYPGFTYYPSSQKWVKGDPSLSNAYIHSLEMNYIHEWARREHKMVMNFGVGYDLARGIHEEDTRIQTEEPYIYSIYCNTGKSNIVKGNMMLIYKYQAMTMSFAGNVFFNSNENIASQRPFYNLSISPVFNFHNRWTLTGRILYNSAIQRENSVLGECLFTQAKISKDIKTWTLSLVLNDITGFPSQDYTHGPDKSSFTSGYNLYTRYIGLHVNKKFN
ncbi:MAG: TonB-dependent receptor [Bacteroidales bacterium]|nr:TonB-dependent receptor [Candidatus Cryptobacteroides equifaecalis]